MENPSAAYGEVIEAWEEYGADTSFRGEYDDVSVSHYILYIRTSRGMAVVRYENESNGYYGGSLDPEGSAPWREKDATPAGSFVRVPAAGWERG